MVDRPSTVRLRDLGLRVLTIGKPSSAKMVVVANLFETERERERDIHRGRLPLSLSHRHKKTSKTAVAAS